MEEVMSMPVVKTTRPPLFKRENSDPQVESILRSGRCNSADIVVKKEEKRRKHRSSRSKKAIRSKSVGGENAQFMSPLSFENIDVLSTPLSSLRSCSEYNRGNTVQRTNSFIPLAVENEVRKGFWSTLFFWTTDYDKKKSNHPSEPLKKKQQQRVRFRSRDSEEQSFLVEHLRFNEANLVDGEDYNYRQSTTMTNTTANSTQHQLRSSGSFSAQQRRRYSSNSSSEYSWQDEIHSFNSKKTPVSTKGPMEIELKTIRIEYFSVYSEASTTASVSQPATINNVIINNNNNNIISMNNSGNNSRNISRNHSRLHLIDPNVLEQGGMIHFDNNMNNDFAMFYDDQNTNNNNIMNDYLGDVIDGTLLNPPQPLTPTTSSSSTILRRVTSFRTLERVSSENSTNNSSNGSNTPILIEHTNAINDNNDHSNIDNTTDNNWWEAYYQQLHIFWRENVIRRLRDYDNQMTTLNNTILNSTTTNNFNNNNNNNSNTSSNNNNNNNITPGAAQVYELLRIQPFSSGGYLRGMLLVGLSSTIFQMYNVITWPDLLVSALSHRQHTLQLLLFTCLGLQMLLNVLQFPWRIQIHLLCWEAARCVDTESAMVLLRNLLTSDCWLINRWLGSVLDVLSLANLVLTEGYLVYSSVYGGDHSNHNHNSSTNHAFHNLMFTDTDTDTASTFTTTTTTSNNTEYAMRQLVISLCATNLLTLLSRLIVAVTYSFTLHDPHILSEARRRGMSKFDIENLPSLVFAREDDCSTRDCAICLSDFELGEMLIALPCDARKHHCFHATCLRTWLTRQNSCPLCQRVV